MVDCKRADRLALDVGSKEEYDAKLPFVVSRDATIQTKAAFALSVGSCNICIESQKQVKNVQKRVGAIVAVVSGFPDLVISITASQRSKVKSSVARGLRNQFAERFPLMAPHMEQIMPKKEQLEAVKLPERCTLYTLGSTPLFYQHMDDPLIPHLRVVHAYPDFFPRVRVDRGAIRFVMAGAALMTPGMTSQGGRLPQDGKNDERYSAQEEFPEGTVVVIEAEGKDHACAVGMLSMSSKEMREKKKGVSIEAPHTIGDGLWRLSLD